MVGIAALNAFLTAEFGRDVYVLRLEPMPGNRSSSITKVVADHGEGRISMVLRSDSSSPNRPVFDDPSREWAVLSALSDRPDRVAPTAYFADLSGGHLGHASTFTEFIDRPSLQVIFKSSPRETHDQLVDVISGLAARIHQVDLTAFRGVLEVPADWNAYMDRRLAQWAEHVSARTAHEPATRHVTTWLAGHRPPPLPLTLVHGDFRASNIIVALNDEQLAVAVCWDFVHIGDPREDLGSVMMHESISPPNLMTDRREHFCERYRELTGLTEHHVNPAALGWFSLTSPSNSHSSMMPAPAAAAHDERPSGDLGGGSDRG